jgi:tRNA-dihydrouridine synthase B
MKLQKIKVGKHEFVPVIPAPLSGVTDLPFRKMINSFSQNSYSISEMIASRAMILETKDSLKKAMHQKSNGIISVVQLAGCEPDVMADAAKLNQDLGADIIDINFGCPVKKVVNGNAGSALMKQPELAIEIVKSVVNAVKIPVTVKMRMGWDKTNLNAPFLAKQFEEVGASMLTIHGRTRNQLFDGEADWKFVSQVKNEVKIPVIVNGDIKTFKNGVEALNESGADGIMIGRGLYGKPWIIRDFMEFFNGSRTEATNFTKEEVGEIALTHFKDMVEFFGERIASPLARKHLGWYSAGFNGSANFRGEINMLNEASKIEDEIKKFFFETTI